MGNDNRVSKHAGCQSLTAGVVVDDLASLADPDSLKAVGMASRPPSRQQGKSVRTRELILDGI